VLVSATEPAARLRRIATAGILFQGGAAAVDTSTIIATFIYGLTGSTLAVRAAAAIARYGWLASQLIVGYLAQRHSRRMPSTWSGLLAGSPASQPLPGWWPRPARTQPAPRSCSSSCYGRSTRSSAALWPCPTMTSRHALSGRSCAAGCSQCDSSAAVSWPSSWPAPPAAYSPSPAALLRSCSWVHCCSSSPL
jgi:hypothetical protein